MVDAIRSPHGWMGSGCLGCAATKSSCHSQFSRCQRIRWRFSCGISGRPTARCAGMRRSARDGSTTRPRAGDLSTTLLSCCFASVYSLGSSEFARLDIATRWHLYVYGAENQAQFLNHVGVHGGKAVAAREVLTHLESVVRNANLDTVPREVWSQVKALLVRQETTHRNSQRRWIRSSVARRCGSTRRAVRGCIEWQHCLKTGRFMTWPQATCSGIKIVEITSLGEMDVYDGTVDGTHNFVAQWHQPT